MSKEENVEEKPKYKTALRFKKGAYLTPKVVRIMLHIARGKNAKWIAQLYNVRVPFVYYVGRKTGFSASVFSEKQNLKLIRKRKKQLESAW